MSGDFYDYLSDDAKRYLRLLDIFKTKNGEITRLYSIDLDLENIPIEKQKDFSRSTVMIISKKTLLSSCCVEPCPELT